MRRWLRGEPVVKCLLRSALGGEPMGSRISLGEDAPWSADLYVQVMGSAPLESVELIRSGAVASGIGLEGRLEAELHHTVEDLEAGEYVYVRVIQEDGGMAWSSPFFLEP